MTTIKIKENATFEFEFRKFKRMCDKANIANRLKEKSYYEKPTTKRRRVMKEAIKREYNKNRKYRSL